MPWAAAGVAATLVGGAMQSNAAKGAAKTQARSADAANAELARQYDLSRTDMLGQYQQNRTDMLGQYQQNRADTLGQYNQGRSDQAPWMHAGADALGQLTGRMPELTQTFNPADLENDPGYKFELEQGMNAINAQARGGGTFDSGNTLKALMGYGQGLASQRYDQAFNRNQVNRNSIYNMLAGISGTGQTTANQLSTAGANTMGNLGSMGANTMGNLGSMGSNVMSQIGAMGQNNANSMGSNIVGAGNAAAAGQVGSSNAWANAIGQGVNGYQQQQWMNRMNPQSNTFSGFGTGNSFGNQDMGGYL